MTQAAESAAHLKLSSIKPKLIYRFYLFISRLRILFDDICYCKSTYPSVRLRTSSIAAFSVQLIRAPQIGSAAEYSAPWPREASDDLAPAPPISLSGLSRASARSGSRTRTGTTRPGPQRDKRGHSVTVATPGGE